MKHNCSKKVCVKISIKLNVLIDVRTSGIAHKVNGCPTRFEAGPTIRVGPDIRFGRILAIEIIRSDIQYCRIFSLTLLQLSGLIMISDNLVFKLKQH